MRPRKILPDYRGVLFVVAFWAFSGFLFNTPEALADTHTSTSTGGNWNTKGTWIENQVPADTDDAVIATTGGGAVNVAVSAIIANLTINSGATLIHGGSKTLDITGNYTNNGTHTNGTSALTLSGAGTTIDGSGSVGGSGNFSLSASKTIAATANLTVAQTIAISAGVTITNNGIINADGDITGDNATTSIWSSAANSTLNVKGALLSTGTLTATASPNTVKYTSTTAGQTVKSTTYHHLTIDNSGQTATLGNEITVNGDLAITNGTLDTNNSNINIAGSWSNSSNFIVGTGAVEFTSASQSDITGTTTFYDLTVDTNAAGAKAVRFGAGQEQTVSHTLTLKGYAGKVLTILSTTDSSDAFLTLQAGGAQSLDYLDVYDNNASNGQALAGGVNSAFTRTTNWVSKFISVTLRDAADTSDYTTWAIGSNKSLDTAYLMTAGNCVLVKNNGNVSEDFSISAVGTNWTLESSTAENTCVLMGLFNGDSAPIEGDFSTTYDIINGTTRWATTSGGIGNYEGTNDGDSVAASAGEKLYIYLKTPSSLSQGSEESITVTVGCREH